MYTVIIVVVWFLAFNAGSKILPKLMSWHNIGSYVDIDSFSLHFLCAR